MRRREYVGFYGEGDVDGDGDGDGPTRLPIYFTIS